MANIYTEPSITKAGLLSMQVCVPKEWTDNEVKNFAEGQNPCGTMNGWQVRKEDNELLEGQPERVNCAEREGFVHVLLDA